MKFTPKGIILEAIKSKLEPFGITKVMLLFSCETDLYNIAVSNTEGKSMKIDITEDEINTIKKMFINRIKQAWLSQYDIEPKNIIVQINLTDDKNTLQIFITDFNDKVLKFDY